MKILIATDTYPPNVNGASYFTHRLANNLAKRGENVSVICPSTTYANKVKQESGVTVYEMGSIPLSKYQNFRASPPFFLNRKIRKILDKSRPDVVHIQGHFFIGKATAIEARALGIPIVGTNHFMPENLVHYFHLPQFAERWLRKFSWKQCIRVFEKLDAVTTPTIKASRLLSDAGLVKEIIPLSCGIDLKKFKPNNDGQYLRQKYNIPNDKSVLLYVGRLDKEKRIEVIINALNLIAQKNDIHLILAGQGKERENLEKLSLKIGVRKSITFTGFVEDADLPNLYTIADIFVIAGIAELQSIVTMEAMASGLPVVAVNKMALPELVRENENGYLFPEDDSSSLAKKVTMILSDPNLKKQMSGKSLEIVSRHDVNTIIGRYIGIYKKLQSKSRS